MIFLLWSSQLYLEKLEGIENLSKLQTDYCDSFGYLKQFKRPRRNTARVHLPANIEVYGNADIANNAVKIENPIVC